VCLKLNVWITSVTWKETNPCYVIMLVCEVFLVMIASSDIFASRFKLFFLITFDKIESCGFIKAPN